MLSERTPEESISHRKMPSPDQHKQFVESQPYRAWYFIQVDDVNVGTVYLTVNREIGVFIFKEHRNHGYAEWAVIAIMDRWPGVFYANIAPDNEKSEDLFMKLGFKLIQHTYRYE